MKYRDGQLLKFVYVNRSAPVPFGTDEVRLDPPWRGDQAFCIALDAVAWAIVESQAMNLVVQ